MADGKRRVVYRWDLDKTYLSTDFDSVRGLIRTAFEAAADKRTLPGADLLLRELSATSPEAILIVSGSPELMRKKLEQKLALDGIRWDELVLKPSLNRLLRGRFRFLRDQISYKLGALLTSRLSRADEHEEVMFGDDAEADAFVYSLYADLCAGRVGAEVLSQVLTASRAYEDDAAALLHNASQLPRMDVCRRIFIHLERVQPSYAFEVFGPRVCAFHNYFQPALMLVEDGLLAPEAALRVGFELVSTYGFSPDALSASYRDLVRRNLIRAVTGEALRARAHEMSAHTPETEAALDGLRAELALSVLPTRAASPKDASPIDYVRLLPEDKARARRAKHRALLRRRR